MADFGRMEIYMMNPFIELNNGVMMPRLGLGLYKTTDEAEMQTAVTSALEACYQSFDTAQMYQNEELLGHALQQSGAKRENLFLTSKVDLGNMGYDAALASFEQSLNKLKTEYLDLFLIHWPGQQKERCVATWRALEKLYYDKRVRAIGVSNFYARHLDWLLLECDVIPAVNQIERNPLLQVPKLSAYCQSHHIKAEAWSPLLRGNFELPVICGLAQKHNKTPAQIILRWDIQSGYIVIPKSVHRERIFENAAIFDFFLEEEDMALIDSLDTNTRSGGRDPDTFDF